MGLMDNNNGTFTMPVQPMGTGSYGGNAGGFGFGNDGSWWFMLLFLALIMNNGWGNNNGGYGATPYIVNNTSSDIQRGFDQQAVVSGIAGIQNGICDIRQDSCNNTSAILQGMNTGFSSAEIAANSRQMANMQQQFNSQTAITSALTGLSNQFSNCCCENRLATANLNSTILAENCADRQALSDGIRDILVNANANTQRMVDTTNQAVQGVYNKICQLELDAKNDRIAELQARNVALENAAARAADRAVILADNAAQTAALENYLNPPARPAYIVQNPNCCGQNYYNGYGCGCSA